MKKCELRTKSMQKIFCKNYWIRWLQSKEFRFSKYFDTSVLCTRLTIQIFKPSYDVVQLHSDLCKTPLVLHLHQKFCGNFNHRKHSSFVHKLLNRLTHHIKLIQTQCCIISTYPCPLKVAQSVTPFLKLRFTKQKLRIKTLFYYRKLMHTIIKS
jgi:hypothetical protein